MWNELGHDWRSCFSVGPITGNGVTAALRHADEATALIRRYRRRGTIPTLARTVYNLRVSAVGLYFNSLIEKLFYQPALRDRLGLFGTARIYTLPAWLMNLIYTHSSPWLPRSNIGDLFHHGHESA